MSGPEACPSLPKKAAARPAARGLWRSCQAGTSPAQATSLRFSKKVASSHALPEIAHVLAGLTTKAMLHKM